MEGQDQISAGSSVDSRYEESAWKLSNDLLQAFADLAAERAKHFLDPGPLGDAAVEPPTAEEIAERSGRSVVAAEQWIRQQRLKDWNQLRWEEPELSETEALTQFARTKRLDEEKLEAELRWTRLQIRLPSWLVTRDEDWYEVGEAKDLAEEEAANAAHAKVRIPQGLRVDVFVRDKYRCVMCGRAASDGVVLHADHIVPESQGGETTMENLQTLCADCNVGKGNRYSDDLRG